MVDKSPHSKRWIRRNYQKYLKSAHWQKVKKRYKASKLPWECYTCGKKKGLDLHHKSYKHVGEELLRDLVPLCQQCHAEVHRYVNRKGKGSLWSATEKVKKRYLANHSRKRVVQKLTSLAVPKRSKIYTSDKVQFIPRRRTYSNNVCRRCGWEKDVQNGLCKYCRANM